MGVNGLAMGLFASPNRAAVMNSLPPDQRGAGAGMSGVFQNAAMVLSMGIFFTLMISGIASVLPQSLYHGLVAQHVPVTAAAAVSHLPPITSLFASLLGYNPMAKLLPAAVIAHLPAHLLATLRSRSFFPTLLAKPFSDGLTIAFTFGAAACALAALASLLRGGKYVHGQGTVPAAAGEAAAAVEASSPLPPVASGHAAGAGSDPGRLAAGSTRPAADEDDEPTRRRSAGGA